jgi:hypothetical protein
MKRLGFLVALLALVLWSLVPSVQAQSGTKKKKKSPAKKIAITCPAVLNGINDCPDTGCGKSLDPLLNQQKNPTQGDPDTAENMTFTKFAKLPKIVPGYLGIGFPRDKLKERGEGDMVRVIAWAIDSRPQNTRDKRSAASLVIVASTASMTRKIQMSISSWSVLRR